MKRNYSVYAVAVMLLVGMASCSNTAQGQKGGVQHIGQAEFLKIQQQPDAVVIDVRTPGEVSEGVIKGATVFADVSGSDFDAQVDKLDKGKTYLVYCRSGARSSRAANMMADKGFTKVYNLQGGISSWSGEVIVP